MLRVNLTDYRNYAHLVWTPGPGINVLTGPNGSGKTNLLEALSLLSPGRGLRHARSELLTRHGSPGWAVASRIQYGASAHELGTGTIGRAGDDDQPARARVFRLDGGTIRSQADLTAIVSIVWLTPQMERLFGEGGARPPPGVVREG